MSLPIPSRRTTNILVLLNILVVNETMIAQSSCRLLVVLTAVLSPSQSVDRLPTSHARQELSSATKHRSGLETTAISRRTLFTQSTKDNYRRCANAPRTSACCAPPSP